MENEILNKKILQYLNDELQDEGKAEIEKLIHSSNEVNDYYNDIKLIVDSTKHIDIPEFSYKDAYSKVSRKWNIDGRNINSLFYKIAAVFIIGLFISIFVIYITKKNNGQFVEIYVKKGDKVNITLPDGNIVYINSNSTIKYTANFTGLNKKIYIEGEAFFELAGNSNYPLNIYVKNTLLQGINASFNVKSRPERNDAEIIVDKGQVTLANDEWDIGQLYIEEGQSGYFNDLLPLFISENKNENYLAWKTEKLKFNKMPLKIVARTLSEYYEVPITINGEVQYCDFTATYEKAELKKVLKDIEEEFKPYIKIQTNKVIIKGDNC